MDKNKRKFSKEYKELVKQIYQTEGLKKAQDFVQKDYPKTTNRTIKSWVDEEYGIRVKETRRKSYEKEKCVAPEKVNQRSKISYEKEKERRKNDPQLRKERVQLSTNWANKNRPRVRELDRKYWQQESTKQKRYEYIRNRKEKDLKFHLKETTRARAHSLLKKVLKNKYCSTEDLYGCTSEFLAEHLRSQYKPGMTDQNYGKEWHVDHIKPCSLFNLADEAEFKQCWHYTNLQPLWAHENLSKSNKYNVH